MSLFGSTHAVLSLGVSCQTAWQIDRHRDYLSGLVGEPLARHGGPFDWLIMPPLSFAGWMNAGGGFPDGPDAITPHPNFFWRDRNLHFWHEFQRDGAIALEALFESTRTKFNHLFERFWSARSAQRTICFVSNTQSNLETVRSVSPGMDFRFTPDAMGAVTEALKGVIGPAAEVHFVTTDPIQGDGAFSVHVVRPHPDDVFGNDASWREVFGSAVSLKTR